MINKNVFLNPSFYAHVTNALIILITLIILIKNYNLFKNINVEYILILLLLLSIAFGIHGISHLGLEKIYGYNPLYFFLYDDNLIKN